VFPARVLLVAAMNPCPCGAEGGPTTCRCREAVRARYVSRVSGPLIDRFDLRLVIGRPEVGELLDTSGSRAGESTDDVARRVASARAIASRRGVTCNASIPGRDLDRLAPLASDARDVLESRLRQGRLSARGLHRVRRVARTVADLSGREEPLGAEEVLAALGLRSDVFAVEGIGF
jgi:magnesium chelatase family protein